MIRVGLEGCQGAPTSAPRLRRSGPGVRVVLVDPWQAPRAPRYHRPPCGVTPPRPDLPRGPAGWPTRWRAPMSAAEIGAVIRTLRRRAAAWRPTAVAEVAAEQADPFRVLIACLLSLRTQDATTARGLRAALRRRGHAGGHAAAVPRPDLAADLPGGLLPDQGAGHPRDLAGTSSSASAARCPTTSTRCSP